MPRYEYTQKNTWTGSSWTVNLDAGVGRNRSNLRDDVVIVQFFLEALRPQWSGPQEVKRDGICGPITTKAILDFQNFLHSEFHVPIVRDSAVDPIKGVGSDIAYTLGWMHHLYIKTFRHNWPDLRYHAAWPRRAFPALYR